VTTHAQTFTTTSPDAMAAGRADAYDEHRTPGVDLDILIQRFNTITLHLDEVSDSYTAYAIGYSRYVTEVRNESRSLRRIADEDYVEYLADRNANGDAR
jgi:hypothetical protein